VAQTGANPRYSGRVAGSAASVRDALALFGIESPLPGPFGDAEVVAQATVSPHDAAFRELRIEVDGNVFEGEISARDEDGRPYVSAALHSDFVALKPMFFDAPPLVVDGQWSQKPLDPPDLSGADLDLTITARHARLGRLTLDDATMTAKLRDSALDLSLLEARAYRGQLKARGSFAATAGALSMHASAQTTGVDARALLSDGFGKEALGGALDSTVSLDARGETVADMLRGLNGRLTLKLSDGEIDGVDFDRALRRFEKRPLASAQDIRSGSSALIRGSANVIIENGVGALEDGAAQGPGFALAFAGTANFIERSLALKAAAREADPAGKARENGLQIAVDVAGPWDELKIAPDPKAFIRRSGAAAPLLPEAPREEPR
jgi:AsmA protein